MSEPVAPRLLFVPHPVMSPRAARLFPAIAALLAELERRFAVEAFTWPHLGGDGPADWESDKSALVEAMAMPCHVLSWGSTVPLLAAGKGAAVRSYTTLGLMFTPGTLRALGREHEAEVLAALIRRLHAADQFLPSALLLGDELEISRLIAEVNRDVDFRRWAEFVESLDGLDVSRSSGFFDGPALMVMFPHWSIGGASGEEASEMFLRLAPQGRVDEWLLGFGDRDAGLELARRVVAFIESTELG